MRCYICDAIILDKKAKYHPVSGELEPCNICLEIIFDMLYDSGQNDFSLDDVSITLTYKNGNEDNG